ncbi:MAG: hypothetical protein D6715_05850 [Calditrichaeota bacterium]|nr:MAG: hypothetical protein D6715_05850 [Calditrichota bacterium]
MRFLIFQGKTVQACEKEPNVSRRALRALLQGIAFFAPTGGCLRTKGQETTFKEYPLPFNVNRSRWEVHL